MSGEEVYRPGSIFPSGVTPADIQSSHRSSSVIRVLYVDDDKDMGDVFQKSLVREGPFSIVIASNSFVAIEYLSREECDVVVSDYYMPGMDGISLLKKIRESPSSPPFILFTGKGREEVVIEAINNGAAFYLQKTGDPRTLFVELAHKIRQAVHQRRAESALRESEEKFRLLFESARDGILILHNNRVIDANHQASLFFGLRPEDIIGKSILSLSPLVQPDGSDTEEKWALCSKKVLDGESAFMVWRHKRVDGTTFDTEASLNRIILDGQLCIQSVIRDITDRLRDQEELSQRNADLHASFEELKATEDERRAYLNELLVSQGKLRESEQKFRELADLLPQIVYECDLQGRITYANKQAFITFGYPTGDIPDNLIVLDLIVPEDRERAKENVGKIFLADTPQSHEYRALRYDGSSIPILIYTAPIIRNDKCVGFRGIIIDITEQKHAAELLTRSEEQYRTLVEHIQDGVFIIQEGKLQFVNPAFASIVGYSVDELAGLKIMDIIAPEDRAMVLERYHQRLKGAPVSEKYEFSLLHHDGITKVLVHMDVGLTMIQGRKVSIGTIRDVTQKRKAEDALRESERQLADVIDFLPDATFVIDGQGRVTTWNRAMEQLTHVSAGEMLGEGDYAYAMPFYGVKRPILIDIALISDPQTEEKYLAVSRFGETIIAEAYVPDLCGKPVYLWGAASPLRDSKGAIIGAIESIRDITDRKIAEIELMRAREDLELRVSQRTAELTAANTALTSEIEERGLAEAALRESEERYRRLVELSPDAILVHDGSQIIYVNLAGTWLLGANNDSEVIGKGINDFVHPAFIGTAKMSQDLKELEGMKPLISEEKFIRLDKKVIDVEVSSAPIMYQGIPAALVFVRDITRRKKAEEQLRQSAADMADKNAELDFLTNQLLDMNEELDNRVKERTEQVLRVMKQKDEVITQIGHDLKTPLTPLRALLPYLIEVEKNPESKESLQVLLRSVHSIQEQTEKILTIARLSREDIAIRPELIRVLPIIRESVQKNWLFIERKKIQVEITVPEELEVYFSHADATTVFDNVIGNSAKYSLEEGKITVSVRPDGEHVCIMVTDDGIGLSPDEAEHVFDEFYMADSSRHDRYSSGLGLSIVRRIVHLYGGTVHVESEGKGKGSTFILCFPKNVHLTEKMDSL